MFDLGWSKLIIIAIIAIIVVGPKDLPPLLRAIGKFLSQMRRQADEFRAHFNDAMKDTGLDEVRRDIEGIKQTASATVHDIGRSMEDSAKPLYDATSEIERSANLSGNATPYSNGSHAEALPEPAVEPGAQISPVPASPIAAAAAAAAAAEPAKT